MQEHNSSAPVATNATTTEMHNTVYGSFIKRMLDITLSVLALIILSPLLLSISILVRVNLGSPIIFKQRRIGKGNKEFCLLKFRSMSEARDANGIYLPDPERITKLGSFIRKTSIDELPSLINIIKGEMSIIGPRPLPVRYLTRYTPEQLRRHEVRPGLSNPATVNGRNAQTWDEQFAADVWYVEHMNFGVDVKSIVDTIKVVLNHKGATSEDGDSRCEFIGIADADSLVDVDSNYMKIMK